VLNTRSMSYADLLRQHAADPARASRPFLRFDGATWTFGETLRAASAYANLFLARRDPGTPFHVGLLLENRPEFVLAQLGAGLCGAVIVGLNPTRRGEPLARDISHADCQIVLTEERFAAPRRTRSRSVTCSARAFSASTDPTTSGGARAAPGRIGPSAATT
jgi:fatty-acyl-CoA synthase